MDLPQPKCSAQIFLAILILLGFFGCIYIILLHGAPESEKASAALLVLLGVLASGWKDTVGFFFGSSVGSAAKDKVIGDMAGSSTPPPVSAQTITSTVQTETVKSAPATPAAGA
jgi:hypothetical protein